MVLAMASLLLNSCGQSPDVSLLKGHNPPDSDVTSSPEYNFSSFAGTVWKTKVALALTDVTEYTGKHHNYLLVPKHFDPKQADYTPVHDMKIIVVLPSGTHLRIGRLIKDNGIGGLLWVTGTLVEETNSEQIVFLDNLLLAKNQFIWDKLSSSSTNWGADSNMMEKGE